MMKHSVFLSLGSNQGEKKANCARAVSEILGLEGSRLIAQSSWYHTQPWGKEDQDWFTNGVIQVETPLDPHELLGQLKAIESHVGRRDTSRWGPRLIDIDILFYDHLRIESPELTIPHPRAHERNFVLAPMAEIAPHFVHPVLNQAMSRLLKDAPDRKEVSKITD